MNIGVRLLVISVLLLICSAPAHSQTIESLKDEISKAEQEIARAEGLLRSNKNKQSSNLNDLMLIRSNIANRRKIITSLDKKAAIVKSNISKSSREVQSLSKELITLKDDYKKIIVNGYKDYKQSSYLMFLFSSESFYQMNLRNEYLERTASFSRNKAEKITSSQKKISSEIESQKKQQKELEEISKSRSKELASLSQDEKKLNSVLSGLKSEATSINRSIDEQNNKIETLQNRISQIIAEEEAKNRKTVKTEEQKREFIRLSGSFESNKGKLPAPVTGVVVSHKGVQSHPTQKSVKLNNNGINITANDPNVYAIFDGVVLKVFFLQGTNNSILVSHGSYISVYCNLASVTVKAGDKVTTGKKLGRLSAVDGVMNMHFELWQNRTTLDPESWIKF